MLGQFVGTRKKRGRGGAKYKICKFLGLKVNEVPAESIKLS